MTGEVVTLRAGTTTATVHPADGGRLGQLTIDGVEQLRGPEHAVEGWAAWGSYPLVPWSNRIPDGVVGTRLGSFRLPVNWPDDHSAIHGLGAAVEWTVDDSGDTDVELSVALAEGAYEVTAYQSLRLRHDHFDHGLAVVNDGSVAVPVGLGFHPWFAAAPIQVAADAYWPGATPLPEGPPLPVDLDTDLRVLRRAPVMDRCYTELTDNTATVGELTLSWSGPVTQVVVYSGVEGWVCVEPVTMANDGFNMWAAGFAGTGVLVLEPGDMAQIDLRIGWDGAAELTG